MALFFKWMLWILLGLLALFVIVWVYFRFFMSFGASPEEIAQKMAKAPYPVTSQTYLSGANTMHYMEGGRTDKPVAVVFVHGSPGNWEGWQSYLTDSVLCEQARVIAIDRLGYGGSMPGEPVSSIGAHAASLRPLVDSLHAHGKVILVGHSMGGAIVARAAMDFPELLDAVVILAGSADSKQEKVMGIQYFIQHKATRWLIPPDLDMSNRELMPHGEELASMKGRWKDIQIPVTILQGKKDQLVPWQNAEFISQEITLRPPKVIYFPEENHFIPWTQREVVRREIMAYF
ncbi:MAG: alpha/beta hydrolase [Bacteroidetes bacterium]|nr:MAG: alpha/beta hydrolase [Bacteroidota bacterium]